MKNGFVSNVHTKKPKGRPMSERASKANAKRSEIRALVEHPFATIKGQTGLFICTIGMARAKTRIGTANLACDFKRLIWLNSKTAPA